MTANEFFDKREFVLQPVVSGFFYDDAPDYGGKVYAIVSHVVRLNHVALGEWSEFENAVDIWDLDGTSADKIEARERELREMREAFEQKVRNILGITKGSMRITQNLSEVFTVVNVYEV